MELLSNEIMEELVDLYFSPEEDIQTNIWKDLKQTNPEMSDREAMHESTLIMERAYGHILYHEDRDLEAEKIVIEKGIKPFIIKMRELDSENPSNNKTRNSEIKKAQELLSDFYGKDFYINDEVVQDEIPEYEESQKVDINPSQAQTNMASGPIIDLGTGVPIIPDQINEEIAKNYDPSNPARMFLQPDQTPSMIPSAPVIYPNGMIPPQQVQPPLHKVDEIPHPQKQTPQEDVVNIELNKLNFNGLKQPAPIKEIPPVIDNPLGNAERIDETIKENLFDNDEMFAMYPKIPLKEIEDIANRNGHNVSFYSYPYDGLITVITTTRDGHNAVVPKCFTIDCGKIIDSRVKLFAACPMLNQEIFLEFAPVYELFVRNPKSHNKNMLDEKLINDIFIAGLENITKKEMYTDIYKALNRKLALITIPTKGLNKEERNSLQTYLLNMDRNGYFDKALSLAPGSRFAFLNDKLDKNSLSTFTLVNEGVPMYYGTGPMKVTPVIIESKDGQISIRSNGEIIDPGQIAYPKHPEGCTCGHC